MNEYLEAVFSGAFWGILLTYCWVGVVEIGDLVRRWRRGR